MRKAFFLIVMLAVPALLITASASAQTTTPPGFVTKSGTKLRLDGSPYRFTGLNIYNANSVDNCWYTLGEVNSDVGHALHRSLAAHRRRATRSSAPGSSSPWRLPTACATGAPSTTRWPSPAGTA